MKNDKRGAPTRVELVVKKLRSIKRQLTTVMIPDLTEAEQEELCKARISVLALTLMLENHESGV